MRKNTQSLGGYALLAAAVLVWSTTASASTLILSDFSSDSTPASVLGATLEFSDPVGDQITLSVTNDTSGSDLYFVNFVYFNTTSDVASLVLDSVTSSIDGAIGGWTLNPDQSIGAFGNFDYELQGPVGNNPSQIESGETVDFVFTFTAGSTVDPTDFVTEFSTNPPGSTPALAAAKFVRGPGDDSAFGAVVPEPGTLSLLAMGVLGLAAATRRRS